MQEFLSIGLREANRMLRIKRRCEGVAGEAVIGMFDSLDRLLIPRSESNHLNKEPSKMMLFLMGVDLKEWEI